MKKSIVHDTCHTWEQYLPLLLIGLSASFLLFGYEFIRSVSSSLFIGYYGSANLPWVMAGGPLATIMLVYGYGWLLSLAGARRALLYSSVISAALISLCYTALRSGFAPASAVLYMFREAYIVVLVEQYWSFINSTVPIGRAMLVNGPITGFGSIGAIAGASTVHFFAGRLGTEPLLLFAAVSLLPAALMSDLAYRTGGEPQPSPAEERGRQGHLALGLFVRNRYLMLLALLIMLTQAVSTALDLNVSRLVELTYTVKNERTAFFGGLYAKLNIVAFALQFGVAPVAMRFVALPVVHAVIPVIHVAACAAALVRPGLATVAFAFIAFKALDYSLFRAAKEMLYIPLSYDERYRAKSVIDAFGYRLSKGLLAGLSGAAVKALGRVSPALNAAAALAAAAIWLPTALVLVRRVKAGKES